MADTITIRTSTERDVVKIVERGPQGPPGGGGAGGSGTVTSVALAGTGLSITGSPVTTSGTITANVAYGTTAGTACEGNDSRLSNARTPTAHASSHWGGGSDPLSLEDLTVQQIQNGSIYTWNDGQPYGSINTGWGNSNIYGGSINTSEGGGSIDTRGTGSIEFGNNGTRTTLAGTATANRAISLPDATGTVALTSDITKTAVGLGNVQNVDTTNAANISSGVLPNARVNWAAPDAIGSTTPNTVAATNLSASNKFSLPSAAAASPAAGDVYRVTNTLRYRDSTNTERLLLNATDNLANLADTATALSNLGLLGAIRNMKIVSPSSDVTATSSTTLTNVSGMSFSVAANTTYLILTNLQVNCGSGGYNCEISFPSILNNGTTASGFGIQLPGNNAVAGLSTTTATTVRVSNRGAAQTTPSFSILLVRTDSTGGTANFQWAQNQLSSPTSTILTSTRALIIPLTT